MYFRWINFASVLSLSCWGWNSETAPSIRDWIQWSIIWADTEWLSKNMSTLTASTPPWSVCGSAFFKWVHRTQHHHYCLSALQKGNNGCESHFLAGHFSKCLASINCLLTSMWPEIFYFQQLCIISDCIIITSCYVWFSDFPGLGRWSS